MGDIAAAECAEGWSEKESIPLIRRLVSIITFYDTKRLPFVSPKITLTSSIALAHAPEVVLAR
jgi:hypothetical protein